MNLIPSIIQSHRHCTNKWFYTCCWLIITSTKTSTNISIIEYLYLSKIHAIIFRLFKSIDSILTCTSNVKYFFKFLIIITRNGNLIPSVFFGSAGHVIYVVLTLVPTISKTRDWISLSVIRLMCPLRTLKIRKKQKIRLIWNFH